MAAAADARQAGAPRDDASLRRERRAWQWLHFKFGLPKPLLEPLAVERLYLDKYFSIAKARRDLGYEPPRTTKTAMAECRPCYVELFTAMNRAAKSKALPQVDSLTRA